MGRSLAILGVPGVMGGAVDKIAPTCVVSSAAGDPVYAAFSVTFTFSEDVTGFVIGDITVTNGAASNFVAVSGGVYTADITPTLTNIPVTVKVNAGVCTDAAGNPNEASNTLSRDVILYLLRDEFITAEGPPLASPRTCEPGPGTLTIGAAAQQILGGELLCVGSGAAYVTAFVIASPSIPRQAGIMCRYDYNASADQLRGYFGYMNFLYGNRQINVINVNGTSLVSVKNTWYSYIGVLQSFGNLLFHYPRGGTPTLCWIEYNTATPLNWHWSQYDVATIYFDGLRVRQLPAPFDTDYGIAALDVNPGVSGTSYTAVASAIHDLAVTAPNPLANTCELRYRVLDDNNYWTAYFDATGAFKLDSVSGGVATNRISVAAVATAGNTYTIRVICDGTKHNCYTLSGTTWTKRGSEVNVSHQDSQTMVKPVAGVGWTLGRLTSWPRTSAAYAELDKV